MTGSAPALSIVVPVLDEAEALERLVDRRRAMPGSQDEIVVVDGAGDPVCARLRTELSVIYICAAGARRAARCRCSRACWRVALVSAR